MDIDRLRYASDGIKDRLRDVNKRTLIVVGVGAPLALVLLITAAVTLLSGGAEPLRFESSPGREAVADLAPLVRSDPRWSGVRVTASSSEGRDRILVMGSVTAASDLEALTREIEGRAGDAAVDWQVAVAPEG